MATITTHILNSVNGSHAAGLRTELHRIDPSGKRTVLFSAVTDDNGRLQENVTLEASDAGMNCELVFHVADYFARESINADGMQILHEAVFRFYLPDPHGSYHIPMMLAPNSYSIFCSG